MWWLVSEWADRSGSPPLKSNAINQSMTTTRCLLACLKHGNETKQMLGNVGAARQIFERWMEWEPDDNG